MRLRLSPLPRRSRPRLGTSEHQSFYAGIARGECPKPGAVSGTSRARPDPRRGEQSVPGLSMNQFYDKVVSLSEHQRRHTPGWGLLHATTATGAARPAAAAMSPKAGHVGFGSAARRS